MRTIKRWVGIMGVLATSLLAGCGSQVVPTAQPTIVQPTAALPAGATAAPEALAKGQACPSAPGPIEDELVVNRDFDLVSISLDGQRVTPLTALPMGQGLRTVAPVWSPDGQTLAFTLMFMSPDPVLSTWLQIGMICGLDRQTGQGHILARAGSDSESLEEASWTPDGQTLLVTHLRYHFDAQGVMLPTETQTARVTLADGALAPLVRDATRAALSPDGQRLAYIQILNGGFDRVLMVGQADGQQARPVVGPESGLKGFDAPRWSPDGQRLLFVASRAQEAGEPTPQGGWLDQLLSVPVARAHGDPAQIWLAGADGQGLEPLTVAGLDDPRAAWGADGQQIAYITTLGPIMVVDLKSRQERILSEPAFAGVLDWRWR